MKLAVTIVVTEIAMTTIMRLNYSHCTAGESLTEKLGQEAWQCIIMMTAIIMIMMIVGMMMTAMMVIMMMIMVMTIFVDLNW